MTGTESCSSLVSPRCMRLLAIWLVTLILIAVSVLCMTNNQPRLPSKLPQPAPPPPPKAAPRPAKTPPKFASAENWSPPTLPAHLQNADQKDPDLIQHIRENWIIPPFTGRQKVRRTPTAKWQPDFSSAGQPTIVKGVLHDMYNGFFIECGAADGEYISNSLWFELHRNWTGILIEANPLYFNDMLKKNRHAYQLNACLSPTTWPMMLQFTIDGEGGGITELVSEYQALIHHTDNRTYAPVQCFPLYSIMAAIGVDHAHYFSMDIEGAEQPVLKTIPYDDLRIDTFSIEKRVINDENATLQKEKDIEELMGPKGYRTVTMVIYDIILAKDDL